MGVEFILEDMWMTCLLEVGKFPNKVSGLINWALHPVEMLYEEFGLSVNPSASPSIRDIDLCFLHMFPGSIGRIIGRQ